MKNNEFQNLFEKAPTIMASGLSGDYRSLAEFNNIVLAGHQTKYGMEFVTWEWVQDHTALWQGHYMSSYEAAKQDFAVRAGLVPQSRLFGDQQLAEIYRCIHETLESEYPITVEREKELKGIAEQIEDAVPTLEALVYQSNQQEIIGGSATVGIYWNDLTEEKQAELLEVYGDNGNWDIFPIVEIPVPEESQREMTMSPLSPSMDGPVM